MQPETCYFLITQIHCLQSPAVTLINSTRGISEGCQPLRRQWMPQPALPSSQPASSPFRITHPPALLAPFSMSAGENVPINGVSLPFCPTPRCPLLSASRHQPLGLLPQPSPAHVISLNVHSAFFSPPSALHQSVLALDEGTFQNAYIINLIDNSTLAVVTGFYYFFFSLLFISILLSNLTPIGPWVLLKNLCSSRLS